MSDSKLKLINKDELRKQIGARLRKLREATGESMRLGYEIRAMYGVNLDPSYLSRIETGKNSFPIHTLVAFADYYGVTLDALCLPAKPDDVAVDPLLASRVKSLERKIGAEALSIFLDATENIAKELYNKNTPLGKNLKLDYVPESGRWVVIDEIGCVVSVAPDAQAASFSLALNVLCIEGLLYIKHASSHAEENANDG